jgi:hypothetical protein
MLFIGVAKVGAAELGGEVQNALDHFYFQKRYVNSKNLVNTMLEYPSMFPVLFRLNTHQNQVRVVSMVLLNLGYRVHNHNTKSGSTYIAPEEVLA